ncbi:MAG: hypothetical protein KVP17_002447 [Porospora cf. gigantea B]|uniref:uncharacterized protein n=1 Tax=Porospora cf. gigantea B TaxID=2853592 RepID=UPI003571D17B|nr:MAG: hypothetical protein KVP17_002447 [Porospora cf. gigantea B]
MRIVALQSRRSVGACVLCSALCETVDCARKQFAALSEEQKDPSKAQLTGELHVKDEFMRNMLNRIPGPGNPLEKFLAVLRTAATLDPVPGFSREFGSQNPKHLVVFLHGLGSTADSMVNQVKNMAPFLPDTRYLLLDSRDLNGDNSMGWFPMFEDQTASVNAATLAQEVKRDRTDSVDTAANFILQRVTATMERQNLAPENVSIVGHSQGGCMALYLAIARKPVWRSVHSIFGFYPPATLPQSVNKGNQVFVYAGKDDEQVPIVFQAATLFALQTLGVATQARCLKTDHFPDYPTLMSVVDDLQRSVM